MTNHTHFSRPAIAAIAAVLALSTAPAMAQPAADTPAVEPSLPPVAAEPAPAPEAAPSAEPAPVRIAPPAEVVQSVPSSQPETVKPAAPAAAATRTRVETARHVTTTATPSPAKEVLTRPIATPAAAPVADPGVDVAVAQPVSVAPPSAANADVDHAVWWALGAGGLLFVGGLGAVAVSRSRRQPDLARARRTKDRAPTASRHSTVIEPVVATEAAIAVPEPTVVNLAAKSTHRGAKATSSNWSALEEMVAEAPSAENAFLTRSKRMRRAKFLLEHGQPQPISQPATHAAGEIEQEAKSKTANGKSSLTYSFGGKATPRTNWKPATT